METIKIQDVIDLFERVGDEYHQKIKKSQDAIEEALVTGACSMAMAICSLMREAQNKNSLEEIADEELEYKETMKNIEEGLGWE